MERRPALKLLLPYCAGITFGRYVDVPAAYIYIVSLGLIIMLLFSRRVRVPYAAMVCFMCLFAGFGYVRYKLYVGSFETDHISHFTNLETTITLDCHVVRYPEKRGERLQFVVAADRLIRNGLATTTRGQVLVRMPAKLAPVAYGDRLAVHGHLRRPRGQRNPGEFDYEEYLRAQGIFGIISIRRQEDIKLLSTGGGNVLFRHLVIPAKTYLDDFVSKSLPEREASLLRGLLIGERGEIPNDVKDAFAEMGVVHVLAVSGMHVGFVVLIVMGVGGLLRLPYRLRIPVTLAALLFYVCLTNLKPPVVRASTMAGVVLVGTLLERRTDFYNSLAVAALLILLLNPMELFQAGFQLSFSAVVSIVYLHPRLKRFLAVERAPLYAHPLARWSVELLLASGAAFLGTMPFTILYFNRLPNFTLVANLVVVPLVFGAVASAVAASTLHLLLPTVSDLYMQFTWLCLHLTLKFAQWGSALPYASVSIFGFSATEAFAYVLALVLLFNLNYERSKRLLVIFALLASNLLVWRWALSNQQLEVTFLDVGQGDAVLLRFPDGRRALVDGGPRTPYFDSGERIIVPYLQRLGIRKLDAVILSHPDSDHLGGLPYVLRHCQVGEVWDNGCGKASRLYREYVSLIDSLQVPHRVLQAGDIVDEFYPVRLFVVHPDSAFLVNGQPSANESSLAFKLSYGEVDFLLLGDIEALGEKRVGRFGKLLESEVLKVSHHGSRTSSTADFLSHAGPELAVISAGEFNKFGHPHQESLRRLRAAGARILRTDRDAAIVLRSDGKRYWQVNWRRRK